MLSYRVLAVTGAIRRLDPISSQAFLFIFLSLKLEVDLWRDFLTNVKVIFSVKHSEEQLPSGTCDFHAFVLSFLYFYISRNLTIKHAQA